MGAVSGSAVFEARQHVISLIRPCYFPVTIAVESAASLVECVTWSGSARL